MTANGLIDRVQESPSIPRLPRLAHPTLIVYGDFNCPYSYLASQRIDRLIGRGPDVEWRAVEHDRTIPVSGGQPDPDQVRRERDEIRTLVRDGERAPARLVGTRTNTAAATSAYAEAVSDGCQHALRRRTFEEIWTQGRNLSTGYEMRRIITTVMDYPAAWPPRSGGEIPRNWHGDSDDMIIRRMGGTIAPDGQPVTTTGWQRVRSWRGDWLALGTPVVPVVVDGIGRVFRGLDALSYLALLAYSPSDLPGPRPTPADVTPPLPAQEREHVRRTIPGRAGQRRPTAGVT